MKFVERWDICLEIFQKYPEKIKDFLAKGDSNAIGEIIRQKIEPKFKEAYARLTADTPERTKERILFVITERLASRYSQVYDTTSVRDAFERMEIICRSRSETPFDSNERVEAHRLLRDLRGGFTEEDRAEHKRKFAEELLKKHGEKLVEKAGADYVIADREGFRASVEGQYEADLEEVVRRIIEHRKSGKPISTLHKQTPPENFAFFGREKRD